MLFYFIMSAEKRETLSSIYSELSTNSLKANIRNQVKYSVDSSKLDLLE